MSQILLPPPAQPDPEPLAPEESAVAVAVPQRPRYEPEPPRRPSPFWRAVKWPIRKFFKALYLIGRSIRRHRIIALIALVILLAVGAVGGYFVYQTNQRSTSTAVFSTGAPGNAGSSVQAPFTIIVSSSLPPLSSGVVDWLHAHKTYNAQELWSALSPQLQAALKQQGVTEATVQSQFKQQQSQGISYEQFIYTGGYLAPDGTANYTVQVVISNGRQSQELTWYFEVDANNQILVFQDLTLQGQP
jgi:hypothetical protein